MSDSEKARMIIEIVCDYNLITREEMMQRKRDRKRSIFNGGSRADCR